MCLSRLYRPTYVWPVTSKSKVCILVFLLNKKAQDTKGGFRNLAHPSSHTLHCYGTICPEPISMSLLRRVVQLFSVANRLTNQRPFTNRQNNKQTKACLLTDSITNKPTNVSLQADSIRNQPLERRFANRQNNKQTNAGLLTDRITNQPTLVC